MRTRCYFETFGYACDPDPALSDQEADANWYAQEFASLREECRLARSQTLNAKEDLRILSELSSRVEDLQMELQRLQLEMEASLDYRLRHVPLVQKVRRGAGRLLGRTKGEQEGMSKSWPENKETNP